MVQATVLAAHPDKAVAGIWVYQKPTCNEGTRYRFYEKVLQLIGDAGTVVTQVCLIPPPTFLA